MAGRPKRSAAEIAPVTDNAWARETPGRAGRPGVQGSPSDAAGGPDRLLERTHGGQHGRRLVTAVRHAVGAARVLAPAVGVPVGGLDQFLVRLHVPVAHQIAGLLPAEE